MSLDKAIDKLIEDQKNKNTLSKTRDVSLLTKMEQYGIRGVPLQLFTSYLTLNFSPALLFNFSPAT